MRMFRIGRALFPVLCVFAYGVCGGEIRGRMTVEGVTGRDAPPKGWMEEHVFLSPAGPGAGAGAVTANTPSGMFAIPGIFPPGEHLLFTLRTDGIPAFAVRPVVVPGGDADIGDIDFTTPAHYSVMYDRGAEEWGDEPWLHGDDFYQTFLATGPTVTRVATRIADKRPSYTELRLNYAVYEVNDGPPSSWEQISPVRTRVLSPTTDPIIHIFWVAYRSQEVTLVPGRAYAVRFWRDPESQSTEFSLVARPDRGDGYAQGRLYIGDMPRDDWDAFGYVSGGAAGTVVNHAPVEDFGADDLLGWNERFGQTFRASGTGLAAVECAYATGEAAPRRDVTFQVYDGVGGRPIGPAKSCAGLPRVFQGRAAVAWARGEVPLEPGRIYYVEGVSSGLNVWRMKEDLPDVCAYIDGESRAPHDMTMAIAEYAADAGR